ncbi:NAD(P)-dependent dehydrogenase (short-subunit alcohol dehydrogenase family) [Crossiella equi]|uniref:NAD(P)-dependent dehydrogenase (Short-subunit alcohol dehydrogenase family) n=1 Tax=Crossiella equi TaxID=130796 RepID=A0ABS5AAP5_9PSEU|nr:SDR family NAD(P)-dependent oxidoreductase [Crossiella equi]MBP2473656.1 NAD(P)-dependent dehydrogenase (short-subunit alcohol dehydrogenase family) [Crossiella equi]
MSRIVLITGANRGIGLGLARSLAQDGDRVVATGRRPDALRAALDGVPADIRTLDVTDPASAAALAEQLRAEYGHLDVLVNNAAINYDPDVQAVTADLDTVRDTLGTNLFGVWQVTQALLPLLRRSAHPRIVNVSSESGSFHSEYAVDSPGYSVSKAALNMLTKTLAHELTSARFLVNAVCPGWIATDMGGPGGGPLAEGVASVAWAVRLPDGGPTGGFFRHGQPLPW